MTAREDDGDDRVGAGEAPVDGDAPVDGVGAAGAPAATDGGAPDRETLSVRANGLTFECLRAGEGDRLALCLHGFPDDPGTFDGLLGRLSDAGCAAVAPFMRGYAPTEAAPDGDYSPSALGADAVALAGALEDALGCDSSVLVGHDWGAVAGYVAARRDPDAFERMVTMAVPPRFVALLFAYPRQLARSWYIWFFQLPGAAAALRADDYAMVEFLWRTWSPGWEPPEARLAAVRETFRRGETTENALAYYRSVVREATGDLVREGPPDPESGPAIETPTLVVAGERDGCIGPELFERADEALADCRVVAVQEAGHFMHRERPEVVAVEVLSFLDGAR